MKMSRTAFAAMIMVIPFLIFASCKSGKRAADSSSETTAEAPKGYIAALTDSIASDNVITTASAARRPGIAPEYRRRQTLMNSATEAELLAIFGRDNPVVRLTAFEGLYRKNYDGLDSLFAKMIDDNTKIQFIKGDLSEMMPTLEYAYSYILGAQIPGETRPDITRDFTPDYTPDPALLRRAAEKIADYRYLRSR